LEKAELKRILRAHDQSLGLGTSLSLPELLGAGGIKMKRIFRKAAGWFGKWRRSASLDRTIIGTSRNGIWVVNPEDEGQGFIKLASWRSICQVRAHRLAASEEAGISLTVDTPEGQLVINEDMDHWAEALASLESRLPGFPRVSEWLLALAYSPSPSAETVLWTCPTPCGEASKVRGSGSVPQFG